MGFKGSGFMSFADRRDIEIAGKKITIRQRTLKDVLALNANYDKFANNTSGQALLLAAKVKDAIKHDNKYLYILPHTIKSVLRCYPLAQLIRISDEIDKLESYGVKKKTPEKEA